MQGVAFLATLHHINAAISVAEWQPKMVHISPVSHFATWQIIKCHRCGEWLLQRCIVAGESEEKGQQHAHGRILSMNNFHIQYHITDLHTWLL